MSDSDPTTPTIMRGHFMKNTSSNPDIALENELNKTLGKILLSMNVSEFLFFKYNPFHFR